MDNSKYNPPFEYIECTEALRVYTASVLTFLASNSQDIRERVIRNFTARGLTTLQSIGTLWQLGHFQECWILFRTQLDRLFHLHALAENDEFDIFEKWSFMKQVEANHRAISGPVFREYINIPDFTPSKEEKSRYYKLKAEGIRWARPRAEEVANRMGMPFLYKFGYDYASTHVHPMARDGHDDFLRLTMLGEPAQGAPVVVLHNAVLVQLLLTQEGLNASRLEWRAIVYDFLDHCLAFLKGLGSCQYKLTFAKLFAEPEFEWCRTAGA